MAFVYIHRRIDIQDTFANVFYVGIGKNKRRPYVKYGRGIYWNRIVNKFGYDIEITHENVCWEEACAIEKYLISLYGRHDLKKGNLANMTDGGEGVHDYIIPKEKGKNHSLRMKGELNPMYGKIGAQSGKKGFHTGKKHSKESKIKISETLNKRGYKISAELRAKLIEGRKNKIKLTQKQKRSESKIGNKNPMYGKNGILSPRYNKKHTEETKLKMKLAWQKRKEKNENITT